MADETLLRLVRHNTWANVSLLEFCASRPAEELNWTVPGTFGPIQHTFQHIVVAEQGYLRRLSGAPSPIDADRGPLSTDRAAPLAELIERARSNGERLERLLLGDFDPLRVVTFDAGGMATAAIIVAQYIHHGSDHRAHIGTILGAHGVELPLNAKEDGLDLWGYGDTIGES